MRSPVALVLLVLAVSQMSATAHAHGDLMRLGSTQDRRGQLIIEPEFDFDTDVFLEPLLSAGGQTFYTGIIPSFAWVITPLPTPAAAEIYPLKAGTQVRFHLLQVSPGASVKVSGSTLDAPGENALLGTVSTVPDTHVHPEWQLTLVDGVVGDFSLSFKLTTTTSPYAESPTYTLNITNRKPQPTPTTSPTSTPTVTHTVTMTATSTVPLLPTLTPSTLPTLAPTASVTMTHTVLATSTPTASPSPSATRTPRVLAGDSNCDRRESAADLVAIRLAQLDPQSALCDADLSGDGIIDDFDIIITISRIFGSGR